MDTDEIVRLLKANVDKTVCVVYVDGETENLFVHNVDDEGFVSDGRGGCGHLKLQAMKASSVQGYRECPIAALSLCMFLVSTATQRNYYPPEPGPEIGPWRISGTNV